MGIYADYGLSGTNQGKRTGFQRILRNCREGKIDRIICKSISRFARNTSDFMTALSVLRESGVSIFFEKENLDIVKVVPLLAQDMDFDEEYIAKAYGLDSLIDVMTEVLPSELQNTLQNVQIASLESKKKAARAAVAAAVAAAVGEGFAPIPFADAALLIPTQVGMIAGITVIFGLDISKSLLGHLVQLCLARL